MRLDHLSYACSPDGLAATVERVGAQLGVTIPAGGVHPRFGTTNAIVGLADGIYLEIVGVLEHPAAEKADFGRAVKRRTAEGGGWLGWVVSVDDLAPVEARLGQTGVEGKRARPDGHVLSWRQIGVSAMVENPQLPFFIAWESDPVDHPAFGATGDLRLTEIELAGDRDEISAWLGDVTVDPLDGVRLTWVDGVRPGIVAAHLETPNGPVRLA